MAYVYSFQGRKTPPSVAVYSLTLKPQPIGRDKSDGIKAESRYVTINEMFDLWCQIKRGLKNNTFENYKYMYNLFVRPNFGKHRISTLKKSDVKRFCNQLAVDDNYIRNIPRMAC